MGIRSGREGVRKDQVDCYGRIKGLNGKTLQETLNDLSGGTTTGNLIGPIVNVKLINGGLIESENEAKVNRDDESMYITEIHYNHKYYNNHIYYDDEILESIPVNGFVNFSVVALCGEYDDSELVHDARGIVTESYFYIPSVETSIVSGATSYVTASDEINCELIDNMVAITDVSKDASITLTYTFSEGGPKKE